MPRSEQWLNTRVKWRRSRNVCSSSDSQVQHSDPRFAFSIFDVGLNKDFELS